MEEKSCLNCQWRGLLVNVCYRNKSPHLLEMVQDNDYCDCWEPDERVPDWRKPDPPEWKPDTKEAEHERVDKR